MRALRVAAVGVLLATSLLIGWASPAGATLYIYKDGTANDEVWYWNCCYSTISGGKIETGYDMPFAASVALQTWRFSGPSSTLIYSSTGGAPGIDAYHPAASSAKSRCMFDSGPSSGWKLKCMRRS
jgi:hypothetical protein